MQYPILERITGLDTSYDRHSEIHHFGHFAEDLSAVPTPEAYLSLARKLGRSAAREESGTYVKARGNGDLAVFVDTPLAHMHSHFHGIFMVVRNRGSYGLLATMFAPRRGKAYFDSDDRLLL
jgi:hypothetical protein